jgi:UDP-glucose 4-epimerase
VTDSAFTGARCLVTGGAGFIGSNLTAALLRLGARVTVLDSFATGNPGNLPRDAGLRIVEGDVAFEPAAELVRDADYVFHLAAQVGNVKSIAEPVTDAATNVLGTVRLLEACRGAGVRKLVYSSSSAIFGEAERLPIDESHPVNPASFYALSKLTGERYTRLAASLWGVPGVCLRYFNVFGEPMAPNEYSGVIWTFFDRLRRRLPLTIYGDGNQVRDFVFVADVVRANLLAAERAEPGAVYNIGSGVETKIVELARTMVELTGVPSEIVFADFRSGEVRRSLADITRAGTELGYAPQYDLRRGLRELWDARQGQ